MNAPNRPPRSVASNALWAHLLRKDVLPPTADPKVTPVVSTQNLLGPQDRIGTSMRMLLHDTQANLEKFSERVDIMIKKIDEGAKEVKNVGKKFEEEHNHLIGENLELINRCQLQLQKSIGEPAQAQKITDLQKCIDELDSKVTILQMLNQTQSQALQSLQDQQTKILSDVVPLLPLLQAVPLHIEVARNAIGEDLRKIQVLDYAVKRKTSVIESEDRVKQNLDRYSPAMSPRKRQRLVVDADRVPLLQHRTSPETRGPEGTVTRSIGPVHPTVSDLVTGTRNNYTAGLQVRSPWTESSSPPMRSRSKLQNPSSSPRAPETPSRRPLADITIPTIAPVRATSRQHTLDRSHTLKDAMLSRTSSTTKNSPSILPVIRRIPTRSFVSISPSPSLETLAVTRTNIPKSDPPCPQNSINQYTSPIPTGPLHNRPKVALTVPHAESPNSSPHMLRQASVASSTREPQNRISEFLLTPRRAYNQTNQSPFTSSKAMAMPPPTSSSRKTFSLKDIRSRMAVPLISERRIIPVDDDDDDLLE